MGASVDFKSARARVLLVADVADERLVASVDQLVRFQVPLCDESLAAVRILAEKGPFSRLAKVQVS